MYYEFWSQKPQPIEIAIVVFTIARRDAKNRLPKK